MIFFVSSVVEALIYAWLCHSFTDLQAVTSSHDFMGGKVFIFWHLDEGGRKYGLTETFVRLGYMIESIESVYIFNLESLVKDVYFGASHDKTKSLNSLRKGQFVQSTSNDFKKLPPSSDSLFMQISRVTQIASFEWLEFAQNILIPDNFLRWFIQKCGMYVSHCLTSPPTFDLKRFV